MSTYHGNGARGGGGRHPPPSAYPPQVNLGFDDDDDQQPSSAHEPSQGRYSSQRIHSSRPPLPLPLPLPPSSSSSSSSSSSFAARPNSTFPSHASGPPPPPSSSSYGRSDHHRSTGYRDRDRDWHHDRERDVRERDWDRRYDRPRDRDRDADHHPRRDRDRDTERYRDAAHNRDNKDDTKPAEQDDQRSPSPDQDVLAFLRSQQASSGSSKLDKEAERLKMEHFQHGGSTKKSRYQREKEEAERKRKQQEEDAAKAYREFVEAMGGEDNDRPASKPKGFVSAGGSATYTGSRQPTFKGASLSKPSVDGFGQDDDDIDQPDKQKKEPPGKRKRAMDDFLGQLQRDQAEREERLRAKLGEGASISSLIALEGQKVGSRDLGDPLTTNICVLNLPANVTEESLGEFFCQWGDVATVKIMWPRGDDSFGGGGGGVPSGMSSVRRERNTGLTGFVAYMRREDAEFSLKETDGIRWGGALIKTGWSKSMPLPSRAQYVMPVSSKRHRANSPSASGNLGAASSRSLGGPRASKVVFHHRRPRGPERSPSPCSTLRERMSNNHSIKLFIETVANRIKQSGSRMEDMLKEKEKNNPRFAFLIDESSDQHHYFRMCMDPQYQPMLEPKPFTDEGYESLYSTDSGEESETAKVRRLRKADTLGPIARRRFEAMLRSITPRRERIAKLMTFAIEHAFAADAIADILCQSVMIPTTPIPRKMARLWTISDILHNSAAPAPNAWKYRQTFEARLPLVFAHLGQVLLSFPGRMKQEGFRMQINNLMECWENWMVLSPATLEQLVYALHDPSVTVARAKPFSVDAQAPTADTEPERDHVVVVGGGDGGEEKQAADQRDITNRNPSLLKEEEEDLDGEAMDEEDLDGEEMMT